VSPSITPSRTPLASKPTIFMSPPCL